MRKLILFFILAICLAIGLSVSEGYADKVNWNNGYCVECGNFYKMSGASKAFRGQETFYYSCIECGNTIRTHHLMK